MAVPIDYNDDQVLKDAVFALQPYWNIEFSDEMMHRLEKWFVSDIALEMSENASLREITTRYCQKADHLLTLFVRLCKRQVPKPATIEAFLKVELVQNSTSRSLVESLFTKIAEKEELSLKLMKTFSDQALTGRDLHELVQSFDNSRASGHAIRCAKSALDLLLVAAITQASQNLNGLPQVPKPTDWRITFNYMSFGLPSTIVSFLQSPVERDGTFRFPTKRERDSVWMNFLSLKHPSLDVSQSQVPGQAKNRWLLSITKRHKVYDKFVEQQNALQQELFYLLQIQATTTGQTTTTAATVAPVSTNTNVAVIDLTEF
jgi:hypothetical protein